MRRTVPSYLPIASANISPHDTQNAADRALAVIARAILWVSILFMIFPAIDLAVSRWFAQGSVFVLAEQPVLKALREFGLHSPFYIISAMLILIGLQVVLPKRYAFCAPHKPLFVLLSFAAGPVLLVEVLKVLIGRARPRHLLEFGGYADFTPVWQFSGACAHNCSFPSGEAAAAAATLSVLVFVPEKLRRIAVALLAPVLMLVAFNRVLFGGHFLSDIMLAWLFTMLAMVWIWRWTEVRSERIDAFFA